MVMIHDRALDKMLAINKPKRTCIRSVPELDNMRPTKIAARNSYFTELEFTVSY